VKSFHRSILTGALVRDALSLPFMMMGAPGVHAETVIGAEGAAGANCFPNGEGCAGGNSGDGESVSASGNPAMAIGGSGGGVGGGDEDDEDGSGGAGGSAAALATGSSENANVTVSASAQGGDGGGTTGESPLGGAGGDAGANSVATSSGPGVASSSASATGGWGSFGRNAGGAGGDANASSAAVSSGPGVASSSASATGGAGGGSERTSGANGDVSASSGATSSGSGGASSSAAATGRSFLSSDGGNATARANASAIGRGTALAKAVATGGSFENGTANATSSAETAKGALAQAQSTALGSSGQAQSTARTSLAGVSVQSAAAAPTDFNTATTNAIAQGGGGQAFANPGQTAYVFSTASPNKAYAASLIGGASHVASALLGPRDVVFGTAILGANTAPDGFGESNTYSASSTFDFGYGGDLLLGLIDDQVSGFANGLGFQSMEFTIQADGVQVLDVTFGSLAIAESFFRDDVIDLGADLGPNIDLTFGTTLTADGPGGFGFDLAMGGAVPEPSTWAMMLVGFAGLGFAGHRSTKRRAAVRPRA
jgi:hypothetical protein